MSLTTWSWTDIGYPQAFSIEEIAHTISHQYGGGYAASRPAAQKMQKIFHHVWRAMTSTQWLNLLEFWRNVYGPANAFYYPFPTSLYGSPVYGGAGGTDPADGFDADLTVGYGDAPVFTCKFFQENLRQEALVKFPGKWAVEVRIIEVA